MSRRSYLVVPAIVSTVAVSILVFLATRPTSGDHRSQRGEDDGVAAKSSQRAAPAPEVLGVVLPRHSVSVSSRTGGKLLTLKVNLGDAVKKGDVLAKISEGDLPEQIRYAKLAVRRAQAGGRKASIQAQNAKVQSQRTKQLVDSEIASKQEGETATTKAKLASQERSAAVSEVGLAKARLDQLEKALAETEILAPFDGVVAIVYEDAGNVVAPGGTILKINSTELMVRFAGPPTFMTQLAKGATVELAREQSAPSVDSVERGAKLTEATVLRIAPDIDPASEMIIAEAKIDQRVLKQDGLRAGTVVQVARASALDTTPR